MAKVVLTTTLPSGSAVCAASVISRAQVKCVLSVAPLCGKPQGTGRLRRVKIEHSTAGASISQQSEDGAESESEVLVISNLWSHTVSLHYYCL